MCLFIIILFFFLLFIRGVVSLKNPLVQEEVEYEMNRFFVHLHEIVEGLYFYCSLSLCVSVSEQNSS